MKDYINRLARGEFEYEPPVIFLPEAHIEQEVSTEEDFFGEFIVTTTDERPVKGIVYSMDSLVTIENPIFSGTSNSIRYHVHTKRLDSSATVEGHMDVVSSAGEQSVHYVFHTRENKADSSMGKIHNLFHFTNLVQTQPQEAERLFLSPQFERVFIRDDIYLKNTYRMLCKGSNPRRSMEEFLICTHKKSPITIGISAEQRLYENLEANIQDSVVLAKNTWGYCEIHVDCDNACIRPETTVIDSDMFAGNKYEFHYLVDVSRCHAGRNDARICFTYGERRMTLSISIHQKSAGKAEKKEEKEKLHQLLRLYVDFRLKKLPLASWLKKSTVCVERLRALDDGNLLYKLFHAQLLLAGKKREDAGWLIDYVGMRLRPGDKNKDILYAYYLYLSCLQKQDRSYARSVLAAIRTMYEEGSSYWQVLWVLMYLDEDYEKNKTLKLASIKEQFYKGCKSPVMYLEALGVLNEQPVLLRVFDEFELQVLNFGLKQDILSEKLALHIGELAEIKKSPSPHFTEFLKKIYTKTQRQSLLCVICRNLIRSDSLSSESFVWYERAVEAGIRLTNLYEYYLLSTDKTKPAKLPKMLLMYFTHNSTLDYHLRSYLYASVVAGKYEDDQTYETYRTQMESFVIDQIIKEHINDNLARVYQELLNPSMVKRDMAEGLLKLLFTARLTCKNPSMTKVYVKHKECDEAAGVRLVDGAAFVQIYTQDAVIIFEDASANRYAGSVEFTIERLFDEKEYITKLMEYIPQNRWLLLYLGERASGYDIAQQEILEIQKKIIKDDGVNETTKMQYVRDVVWYYYSQYDGYELAAEYIPVDVSMMNTEYRKMVIETYMLNGCFKQAMDIVREYGLSGCSPKRVLRICSYLLDKNGYEQDELLLELCTYVFLNKKYDTEVLEYLVRYFNGPTKLMLELWKAADGFEIDRNVLDERILVQMMFVHSYSGSFEKIFEDYYNSGAKQRLIEAYIGYNSYNYFVKDTIISEDVFRVIEYQLRNGQDVAEIAKLALLMYDSGIDMSQEQAQTAQKLLDELCGRDIVFAFYRKFKGKLQLPFHVRNMTIVEYVANPDTRVMIHYIHMGAEGNREYMVEDMKMIYDGMFVKSFVLFYGESLQYYITEEKDGEVKHTESHNLVFEEMNPDTSQGRYEMINDILASRALNDDATFERLLHGYAVADYVAGEVFHPL